MSNQDEQPESTDRKASFNMMKFVAIIFVIALMLAAIWFFFFTPGDPNAVAS